MANSHIVTFERDIENEIRNKSASLTDIAASSGVIANRPEKSALGWLILVIIALAILASGVGAYVYYVKQADKNTGNATTIEKNSKSVEVFGGSADQTLSQAATTTKKLTPENSTFSKRKIVQTPLDTLFPNVFPYVGKNFIKTETLAGGYIITFSGYNEVYKGILDNESLFLKDALLLYGDTSKNTSPLSDLQLGGLDARVGYGETNKKVYYAFIKPSTIIIADNKDTLQALADAILK
jgi:hypothetical protein